MQGVKGVLTYVVLLASMATSSGCGPTWLELRKDGVYENRASFRIRSDNPSGYGFVSPAWRIDNFAMSTSPPKPKESAGYLSTVALDHQDDGRIDHRERVLRYDLKLVHRQRNAELFVRSVPLGNQRRDSELRVIAREYVESVAGAGYVNVQIGPVAVGVERRFATRVLEEHPFVVSGFPAYEVTFDVANVDQLQMSQDASFERVRVVLVRTNAHWKLQQGASPYVYPVLLIVGYAAHPDDFGRDLGDLDTLLNLIEFRRPGNLAMPPGGRVTSGPPPSTAAPAPPAPTPTPPPGPSPPAVQPAPAPAPADAAEPADDGADDSENDAAAWEGG